MTAPRTTLWKLGVLGVAAVVAGGCGGGDEFATSTPTPTPTPTPAPADGTGGVTSEGADLDGDGIPDAAPASDLGATAEIPDLSGGDVGGGLVSPSDTSPVFDAAAVDPRDVPVEDDSPTTEDSSNVAAPTDPAGTPDPGPSYSGAKIYVDGVVHEVNTGDSFPKDNPVFRLAEVSGSNIEVELIAGEFTAGGGSGVLIDKGELVSLVNASEQLTYRVKFLRPISGGGGLSF